MTFFLPVDSAFSVIIPVFHGTLLTLLCAAGPQGGHRGRGGGESTRGARGGPVHQASAAESGVVQDGPVQYIQGLLRPPCHGQG